MIDEDRLRRAINSEVWTDEMLDAIADRVGFEMGSAPPGSDHRWVWGTIGGMGRAIREARDALGEPS